MAVEVCCFLRLFLHAIPSQRRWGYQIMAPTCRCIGSNLSNMSVRVVARIRPLLKSESEVDTTIRTAGADEKARPNVVKVPNPKNFSEQFSLQFNSVYGEDTTQQEIFDAEGELELPLEPLLPFPSFMMT